MNTTLEVCRYLAAFIVLAEGVNKLERTAPFAPGLAPHQRLVDGLKAAAWTLLVIGAGGALAPLLFGSMNERSSAVAVLLHQLADASVLVGFAILIVRTRVKEG